MRPKSKVSGLFGIASGLGNTPAPLSDHILTPGATPKRPQKDAALRYVPGGRWQLRADVKDRMYTIGYPDSFYIAPIGGGTAVLPRNQAKSFWTHNPALTVGVSRLF